MKAIYVITAFAPLLAAILLLHPAHVPTAAAMVVVAAAHVEPRARRLRAAIALLALGLGLAAVWLLPLLAHLDMALPLAWQDLSVGGLAGRLIAQPIVVVLALLTVAAWRVGPRDGAGRRWLLSLPPVVAGLVAAVFFGGPIVCGIEQQTGKRDF